MLDFHPLANLFPLIEGKAFEDLVEDVRTNGLLDPIRILDGKILDGRNRYRAGIAAGVINPDDAPFDGIQMRDWCRLFIENDPLAWVLSKNLHRRHLDESQRAIVASKLETLTHGGDRRSEPGSTPVQDANLQEPAPLAPVEQPRIDRKTAADMLNVSPRSVASAKKVIEQGSPELVAEVEQGRLAVSVAEKLARLPKPRQSEIIQNTEPKKLKTVVKQEERTAKEEALATRQRALPKKLFGVIQADPAWRFEPYSRETGMDRAPENHYPTQETADIKALPVGTLAANDCVLFLWATPAMLQEALQVMRFWGFEYKSQVVWRKDRVGTGYWFRSRHEVLLVGTRGNVPAPAPGTQWDSVIDAPVGEHSAKPDVFYELIEDYYPNLPKIELNARRSRPGWETWGLEAPEPEATGNVSGGDVSAHQGHEGYAGMAGEAIVPDEVRHLEDDPDLVYRALVAASLVSPGTYTKATAEPIVRAAYACDPIIPTKQLADDLGHPVGTVLTWASRLGLTSTERRQANRFVAGGGSEC
jgi:N6-adenosine-specific RNA methylase IME4